MNKNLYILIIDYTHSIVAPPLPDASQVSSSSSQIPLLHNTALVKTVNYNHARTNYRNMIIAWHFTRHYAYAYVIIIYCHGVSRKVLNYDSKLLYEVLTLVAPRNEWILMCESWRVHTVENFNLYHWYRNAEFILCGRQIWKYKIIYDCRYLY